MECVRVFNNELSSLYEVKPPISKAKMTQITKTAIKGIKFYKHIVQSVEKFIQKCRPEYKVPGLYVVDSIVRQSRHQFGADKDVFGPRFVKNITITFQHLFKCPEDERPKIIRVLNLWQKNAVFPIEVIQPLMDMGHPNSSNEWPLDTPADMSKESPVKVKEEPHSKSSPWKGWPQSNDDHIQDNKPYAEMSTKNLEKFNKAEMSNAVKEETSHNVFKTQLKQEPAEETVKFNKKLLDFDYGDEEDEDEGKNDDSNTPNALALSMAQNLLSNPELLRQLHQMTSGTLQPNEMPLPAFNIKSEEPDNSFTQDMQNSPLPSLVPPVPYQQPAMPLSMLIPKSETDTDDRVLPEPVPQPRDLDERSLTAVVASHDRLLPPMCLPAFSTGVPSPKPCVPDKDDRTLSNPPLPSQDLDERSLAPIVPPPAMPAMAYPENNSMQFQFDKNGIPFQPPHQLMDPLGMEPVYAGVIPPSDSHVVQNRQGDEDERIMYSMPGEPPLPPQDFDERQIILPMDERGRKDRSRSRSRSRGRGGRHRSRSRSPRRKRSTSRSRSRKNRSRSRERERIREKERERERERERRRKGLPPVKKGCFSVCSTTLWLGHVPKSCSEMDISETFESFGTILSIDMIPPRGCAYVVMDRRQDANRALLKLKNVKLQGCNIKMAWAPGKGVKGKEYKEYWDVALGVSYVPYEKVKEEREALDLLEEGGFIDEDSLPENLKALRQQPEEKTAFPANNAIPEGAVPFTEMPTAPNMVPPPIMPPTSVGLPIVLPHMMQTQFGLHLPGMMPHQAMVMQVPMGIPPPAPMLMVQQPSQGMMTNQLPMVGGVPPMVPRTIPPVTTLPSHKMVDPVPQASAAPPTSVGDATPTEEENSSVNSPKVPLSVPNAVTTSTLPVPSTQVMASMSQFNPMLGLNTNRPIISVPPPVSTACTPIPYPPPNVNFNFPPPMRPGQPPSMPPNAQFPWMHKQVAESDCSQSSATANVRPGLPPQPGMPPHMVLNRPPFHDPKPVMNSSPMKDSKTMDNKDDSEQLDNRNASAQHDKSQEMVISTDDECSMDMDYARNDMPPVFPADFHRGPMNMPRMRGPPGPMPHGPRFPPSMGSPFPVRMGGPRGMGGPGMHGRMEMDFPHGPRGPRMSAGPRGPLRNDNMHPHDGRDWYQRDYEGPYFERERDRRFRDDWGRDRDGWVTNDDVDSRRGSRDHRDRDDDLRRDERRESWNRDRSDNSRFNRDNRNEQNEPSDRVKNKPPNKGKGSKNPMDDFFRLTVYQKNPDMALKVTSGEQPRNKPNVADKKESKTDDHSSKQSSSEQNQKREREREQRKRSRWGRTLSEEREFQQQKQNEIELKQSEVAKKFQSYEQSHSSQRSVENSTENTGEKSYEHPVESTVPNISENPVENTGQNISENSVESTGQNNSANLVESTRLNFSENPVESTGQNQVHPDSDSSGALKHSEFDPCVDKVNQNVSCLPVNHGQVNLGEPFTDKIPASKMYNPGDINKTFSAIEDPPVTNETSLKLETFVEPAVNSNKVLPNNLNVPSTDPLVEPNANLRLSETESYNSSKIITTSGSNVSENNPTHCSAVVTDLQISDTVEKSASNGSETVTEVDASNSVSSES